MINDTEPVIEDGFDIQFMSALVVTRMFVHMLIVYSFICYRSHDSLTCKLFIHMLTVYSFIYYYCHD